MERSQMRPVEATREERGAMGLSPAILQPHQQALGKIVGDCFVEALLGCGPHGGVYRARGQIGTAYLLVLFFPPRWWEQAAKQRFVHWYLSEVERHFPYTAP